MRIIAGERRGFRLESPKGADVTRPITDRVKENLFNIIQALTPGATVLDLFAGTGSLGLEALSRGAEWVTFVEQNLETAAILERNAERLGYREQCRILRTNVLRLRPTVRDSGNFDVGDELTFDLVFIDPPYKMIEDKLTLAHLGDTLSELVNMEALDADAMLVLRYPSHVRMQYPWGGLTLRKSRKYGSMTLDFLRIGDNDQERQAEDSDGEPEAEA